VKRSVLDDPRHRRIVVLTGAGVSVASGLRPYRGPGGLWAEAAGAATAATARAVQGDPAAVWRLFGELRRQARAAAPNAAHLALADWQRRCLSGGRELVILTQNIDGLHQRAGSPDVVELHGSAFRTRCTSCKIAPFPDEAPHPGAVPACPACGAPLRPDVVLFDEPLPVEAERRAKNALRSCDLFVAVGTSGTVSPASSFVRAAEYAGAHTVLVNLEPMQPRDPAFLEERIGPAEVLLPQLLREG